MKVAYTISGQQHSLPCDPCIHRPIAFINASFYSFSGDMPLASMNNENISLWDVL